jgi:hypothetical protein
MPCARPSKSSTGRPATSARSRAPVLCPAVAELTAGPRLGRCVRKGERGIPILAPGPVKDRGEDGEETGDGRLFFRTVHVFDTLSL